MKIVIELPETLYENIKSILWISLGRSNCKNILFKLVNVVKNGTPLPKGHGDLVDRRELKKEVYRTTEWNGDVHRIIYEASIDDAKPIIEADKGEE